MEIIHDIFEYYIDEIEGHRVITSEIDDILSKHNVESGFINVTTESTTATVLALFNDEDVILDLFDLLRRMIPDEIKGGYRHNHYDNNAAAILKRAVLGRGVWLSISEGLMKLALFEDLIVFDFDANREKKIRLEIIKFS